MRSSHSISDSPLGNEVHYPTRYDPNVLFAIERAPNRTHLTLPENWLGEDIWYAYELSWLNEKGKPMVAIGRFSFPWHSPFLVESKSFKLYLNSLNETHFAAQEDVKALLVRDLSALTQSEVDVQLYLLEHYEGPRAQPLEGTCIDQLDVAITHYQPAPELLTCNADQGTRTETLVSHLLKSNCPVTGQPDWGTVQISYTGTAIDHAALLRYIVSFRKHTEFHEHCVERIYHDLMQRCQPEKLFVMARYTRRGGLDINPWRSNYVKTVPNQRTERQ